MKCAIRLRSARRRGLSILEVLVSIGILTLGLLGVVALIPIAAQHLRRGMALDDATAVARAGIADFQARGGANIQKWLRYQPGSFVAPPTSLGQPMGPLVGVQFASPFYPPPNNNVVQPFFVDPSWAICIDPLMYESSIAQDPAGRDPSFFPYQPQAPLPAAPAFPDMAMVRSSMSPPANTTAFGRMIRVTLNWGAQDWRGQPDTANLLLNTGLANSMCISADDLLLNSPGSEPVEGLYAVTVADDESPASQYDVNMQSWDALLPADRVKRNYQGNISWFATLVPLPGIVSGSSRYYTLSVAVVEQRDLVIDASRSSTLDSTEESLRNVEGERTCGLEFVNSGGGLGGGEVRFVSYPTTSIELARKNLTRLREGNWILASGPNPQGGYVYHWYRIGTIESDTHVEGTSAVRRATLRGPDWPGVTYPNGMAEAIIVSNVINVFEQTIELRGE